jgi:hypothetical protein
MNPGSDWPDPDLRPAAPGGEGAGARPLARRDLALIALGVAVWIALGSGAVWFAHLLTKPRESCARVVDPQTREAKGVTSPGHGLNVLTGSGSCR